MAKVLRYVEVHRQTSQKLNPRQKQEIRLPFKGQSIGHGRRGPWWEPATIWLIKY